MAKLQYACLALALIVLPSSVLGTATGELGRHLLQNRAASNAKANNGGVVSSRSVASNKAFEEGQTTVAMAVADSFTQVKEGQDASAVAEAQAEAVATAVARVWASALVEVSVEGNGEACGSAQASGTANAVALAKVYAQAIANVTTENGVVADAEAISESVSQATASAAASAKAQGCTTSGTVVAQQTTFAEAIVSVYAEALATALAKVANGDATAESTSEATSEVTNESTTVEQQNNVDVVGMGSGSTEAGATAEVSRGDGSEGSSGEMAEEEKKPPPPCKDLGFQTCCNPLWTRRRSCRTICANDGRRRSRCTLELLSFEESIPVWAKSNDMDVTCACPAQAGGLRGF
ncbi:hypothetical protein BSKO_07946 [Bryopsis sp. KO-2023]|nr:hypothetical protein BSKO_07946 [Bryopsis sp. KO-2023]